MIISQLNGGIGNQLFQYAAGRSLALKNNTEVKVDVSEYAKQDLRSIELFHFNISTSVATEDEIRHLKAGTSFKRIAERVAAYSNKKYYKEPYFHFDKDFFSLKDSVYLCGYFQSELYFNPYADAIRKELQLKDELVKNVKELAQSLQDENSVAIHIRKGDYKNQSSLEYHGILPNDYYTAAMKLMREKIPAAKFYIFSDDPNSVPLENTTVISAKHSTTHFEDFYLMSRCKHNIIANSTFSWWTAWLNNNPEKIVIAPKNWFGNGPKDTQDLIPPGWIKL